MNEQKNQADIEQDNEELYERLSFTVDKGQAPLRIDKFIMTRMEGSTRNRIQQSIEDEMVLVNEKPVKSNYKIKPFDKVVIFDTKEEVSSQIIPENIPLDIVFEDEHILIINKPVGMVVHPEAATRTAL